MPPSVLIVPNDEVCTGVLIVTDEDICGTGTPTPGNRPYNVGLYNASTYGTS